MRQEQLTEKAPQPANGLVLSYLLLPRMGIVGVGISYLIAQTIPAAVVSVWFVNTKSMRESDETQLAQQQMK